MLIVVGEGWKGPVIALRPSLNEIWSKIVRKAWRAAIGRAFYELAGQSGESCEHDIAKESHVVVRPYVDRYGKWVARCTKPCLNMVLCRQLTPVPQSRRSVKA